MTKVNVPRSDPSLATRDDIYRLERQIEALKAALERHDREIQMHVTRMGQLQADIDVIRAAWTKIRSST